MAVRQPGDTDEFESHRRFLNAYYGRVRRMYDATRKYYLFGRDRALDSLLSQPWGTLVEVGPGTGRNLSRLHAARPSARYGGIDACDEMLGVARTRCPYARLEQGFAETADYVELMGVRPQRILFSYCLSMVQNPARALATARRQLAPDGLLMVVDFGDLGGLPRVAGLMRRFLRAFHVRQPDPDLFAQHGASIRLGPCRYYLTAVIGAADGPGREDRH